MARPSEGPKCPQEKEADELVDFLNEYIELAEQADGQPEAVAAIKKLQRLIEILDWANEQVNKRKLYSKKFQLKDKARTAILKERLGEDYDHIVEDAKKMASTKLFEEVANGSPDKDLAELGQDE